MHYQFQGISSGFVAQAQANSQISDSGVALQVSGPTQTATGQGSTYTFGYTNTTAQPTNGLAMKVTLPNGFTPSAYTPNITTAGQPSGIAMWNLPTLPADGNGSVQIAGTFAGVATGTQENFSVEVDGAPDVATGQSPVLAATTYQVTISANPISASVALQSSSAASVDPGTQLSYQVTYQNSGEVAATGVAVSVTLTGDAYDTSTIQAPSANISGSTITWDGSQVAELAALNAGQQGTLNFSVRVANPATRGDARDMVVTATPSIKSDQSQQATVGTPLPVKINTQLSLDETVTENSGPVPPIVGQQTTYMVVLGLRNATNDVGNVVVTASLPQAYSFDPTLATEQEQKNVTYDAGTRSLTWNVGTVPAHTGGYSPIRKLTLMVSVLPDQSNVGQDMSLLTNVLVGGTDAFTGSAISFSGTGLTTQSDPSGQGTVQ